MKRTWQIGFCKPPEEFSLLKEHKQAYNLDHIGAIFPFPLYIKSAAFSMLWQKLIEAAVTDASPHNTNR